jgi:hypothetical protein
MSGEGEASGYAQGTRWEGDDPQELRDCLEAAFDYRGNVTLLLRGDESELEGYLSNRDFGCGEPFVDVFPAPGGSRRRIPLAMVRGVVFSGKDTAAGQSWQTWLKQHEAKEAKAAQGLETESIDRFPATLD